MFRVCKLRIPSLIHFAAMATYSLKCTGVAVPLDARACAKSPVATEVPPSLVPEVEAASRGQVSAFRPSISETRLIQRIQAKGNTFVCYPKQHMYNPFVVLGSKPFHALTPHDLAL